MSDNAVPQVDAEKIATGVASRLIDRLVGGAEQVARTWWAAKKNKDLTSLKAYVASQYNRYSKIKNILYDDEAVEIESLYVETQFLFGVTERSEKQVYGDIAAARRLVVRATAGAGKSFFMRRTFSHLANNSSAHMPLFFELRNLNDRKLSSLVAHLFHQISLSDKTVMLEQVTSGLENGVFAIFLDGFDEIDNDKSLEAQRQILEFSKTYPRVPIVISSRPHDGVAAWHEFDLLTIKPMSLNGVCELIGKLRFDETIKNKFIDQTRGGLYEKHKSFLSIPLLATMMLLTFSETAQIEDRLHVFYSDAFNALLFRHDAKKEAFDRAPKCGLARDDVRGLFAAFCILTYSRQEFHFSHEAVEEYIKQASRLHNCDVNPEAFFHDLRVNVCMLYREGSKYIFSHRSFQEYFAAAYINSCPRKKGLLLIGEVAKRSPFDQTVKLLAGMDPELVEVEWALPVARQLLSKFSKYDVASTPDVLIKRLVEMKVDAKPELLGSDGIHSVSLGFVGPDGYRVAALSSVAGSDVLNNVVNSLFRVFSAGKLSTRAPSRRASYSIDFKEFRSELCADEDLIGQLRKISEFLEATIEDIENKYRSANKRIEEILFAEI